MVNVGPLVVEIGPVVWGTPANFNGFRVLAALLRGTPALGVSHILRYLSYSEADFEVFRPAATRCTDWNEIWHQGGERTSPPLCQI